MLKGLFAFMMVGLVGYALSGFVFSMLIPLVLLAVKLIFFIAIAYVILRIVNPEMADRMKGCCTGKERSPTDR